ncbi:AGE family epimerase/isomerase [Salipaludibacillus sp. LMS25]|uniref:AGE family epimerase/isomerase n=1 Tax=Salipaludibacillus sp. LMS25 TaxID=2924031 RepID=UPI0020D10391|nr:AGE family epimerase/isomerase [Salipaludibacillus sp. LMS25]UTR16029.1 AGE family epimerase/isomerase [Salipaludibacillus sp. LMS25]
MEENRELDTFSQELKQELVENILPYWVTHALDTTYGGFYGYITTNNKVDKKASKGGILNSRILWTFSKAYHVLGDRHYLEAADHAYAYLRDTFLDRENGGVYWMVDHKGRPEETRKHIYNQSFAIYGLAEYFNATGHEESLQLAKELFYLIEKYGYDKQYGGYLEAFTREWGMEEEHRLSEKDMAAEKSMNTHLHILEAYTNLFRVWKNPQLKERLTELIDVMLNHIVGPSYQFILFFDRKWRKLSDVVSYGHDIEGSWLLYEAAEVLGDEERLEKVREATLNMAEKVITDGLAENGGLMNEREADNVDKEKIWWVQAEGMVGFFNAYQLTLNNDYLKETFHLWRFTKQHMIDQRHGEWYWKLDEQNDAYHEMPKVEPWKCPYHNSRCCFELLERLERHKTDHRKGVNDGGIY